MTPPEVAFQHTSCSHCSAKRTPKGDLCLLQPLLSIRLRCCCRELEAAALALQRSGQSAARGCPLRIDRPHQQPGGQDGAGCLPRKARQRRRRVVRAIGAFPCWASRVIHALHLARYPVRVLDINSCGSAIIDSVCVGGVKYPGIVCTKAVCRVRQRCTVGHPVRHPPHGEGMHPLSQRHCSMPASFKRTSVRGASLLCVCGGGGWPPPPTRRESAANRKPSARKSSS